MIININSDIRHFGYLNTKTGREGYLHPFLIEINRKSFRDLADRTNGVIFTIQIAPGSDRLDLNPAGYPISYRSKADALHIDVVAGTKTEIPVPLIPADAITGTVKNSAAEPIIGGRVEAISIAIDDRNCFDY